METQRLLSVREFGRAYGVGRTRIYELLNEGSIEGRKFGARTLITAESAESWAASLPKFEPRQGATISAGARQ